jgi:predicted phage terminase large subunit-like protein
MKEVDPFTFWSQYQQMPILPGGGIIKDDWWCYYDDIEEVVKRCSFIGIFADTAYKKTDAADYTVFQVWGFEGIKRAYLLEQVRAKYDFPELMQAANAIWNKWQNHPLGKNARMMFVEDKASGQSLVQSLGQAIGKNVVEGWLPSEYDAPDDKVSKAKEMAWLVYGGTVWLPNPDTIESAKFIDDEYLPEWREFREDDGHKHDDQIDASTMAVLTWRSMGGGSGAVSKLTADSNQDS